MIHDVGTVNPIIVPKCIDILKFYYRIDFKGNIKKLERFILSGEIEMRNPEGISGVAVTIFR